MSKNQKRLLLTIAIAASIIAFIVYFFDCNRQVTVARLEIGQQRSLIISTDNCWEISRSLFYEVKEKGKVIQSSTFIGSDNGSSARYEVVYAENGTLAGVLETQLTTSEPAPALVTMQNFSSGEFWTRFQTAESTNKEAIRRKWRGIFERLRRENPKLPLPEELAGRVSQNL